MKRDEASSLVLRSIGREEIAFFSSAGFIMNAIGRILCHGKHHMTYCEVKHEWIESQKEQYKERKDQTVRDNGEKEEVTSRLHESSGNGGNLPPMPFISSNDILTTAIFKALNAEFGLMPVNYRNRVEGLTSDHCGNYEAVVGFCKADFQQPEDIRASITKRNDGPDVLSVPDAMRSATSPLSNKELTALGVKTNAQLCGQYRRLGNDKPILPSFCAKRRAIVSVVTNWAGFYEQIVLQGCEHVKHFPVFFSTMPAVMPGAVIYKSNQNTLNILAVQGKPVFVECSREAWGR